MARALQLLGRLWHLGLVTFTIGFDAVLLLILGGDLAHFSSQGICPLLTFQLLGRVPLGSVAGSSDLLRPTAFMRSTEGQALALFIVVFVIFPALVGAARLTPILGRLPSMAAQRGKSVIALHFVLCVVLAAGVLVVEAAQNAGGYETHPGAVTGALAFRVGGWYGPIGSTAPYVLRYFLKAAIFGIAGIISLRILGGPENPRWEFLGAAAELRDVGPALVPVYGAHELEFGIPILAPRIRLVADVADQIVAEHDRLRPGSARAKDYLISVAEECKSRILELIVPPEAARLYSVKFASNTGRAIEIALAQSRPDALIVASPFEQPNLQRVLSWYGRISRQRVELLTCDRSELFRPWAQQERQIVQAISKIAEPSQEIVFVVSEVVYPSGFIVPVDRLANAIQSALPNARVSLIVDGSHSVGNAGYSSSGADRAGRPRCLQAADFYVFAAHKWLLAPSPCGILLTKKSAEDLDAYDEWGRSHPSATPSPEMIGGLRGSLELLQQIGLEGLCRRSALLQRRFLERLPDARVQESRRAAESGVAEDRTAISVLKPSAGHKWKTDVRQILKGRSLEVFMPDEWFEEGVVTVAFPYYVSIWHSDRLRDVLRDCVEVA